MNLRRHFAIAVLSAARQVVTITCLSVPNYGQEIFPRLFIMESVCFLKSPLPQSGFSPWNAWKRFFFFTQDWLCFLTKHNHLPYYASYNLI